MFQKEKSLAFSKYELQNQLRKCFAAMFGYVILQLLRLAWLTLCTDDSFYFLF